MSVAILQESEADEDTSEGEGHAIARANVNHSRGSAALSRRRGTQEADRGGRRIGGGLRGGGRRLGGGDGGVGLDRILGTAGVVGSV